MNFRITTLLFGLLLTMLAIFGLMIAHKKTALDQSLVMPSMRDATIDKVAIKGGGVKDDAEIQFVRIDDHWYLKKGDQQVRVQDFHLKGMIDAIKDAKHEETAPDGSKELSHYGLTSPQVTVVTLTGKLKDEAKEWQFFVGKESPGNAMYYVGSSDRPGKAFTAPKRAIDSFFVKDPNHMRAKRLFDFIESGVTAVHVKKDDKELELKRDDNNLWTIVKPALGFAGFDSEPEEKKPDEKFPPKMKKEEKVKENQGIDSVKSLLDTIVKVVVDDEADFIPLGDPLVKYGLESDKAPMRIDIITRDEKKNPVTDTLLVGAKVANKPGFYYARLASDDGVMRINAKWFDPLDQVLKEPGKIRSLDVAAFDKKQVDAIVLKQEKTETLFAKSEKDGMKFDPHRPEPPEPSWSMILGSEKKKASDTAVNALIEQVLGKKGILKFHDGTDAELKAKDAELGFDAKAMEIAVYLGGIDREKKDDKKEDEKKDDKKDDKKPEAKKEEKKEPLPALKKGAEAEITLMIGKRDKDTVHVRRTLKNGTVTRFTMKKDLADLALPAEGIELAYLELAAPTFPFDDADAIKLQRNTDKGTETVELERRAVDGRFLWYVKDPLEPTGAKLADAKSSFTLVADFAQMPVKKWLKKLDEKEDLDKFGLKNPTVTATITIKNTSTSAAAIISALGGPHSLLSSVCGTIAQRQAEKGEVITIEIGKETDSEKDKPGAFAKHSGSKMLFLVPTQLVKEIKELDLRDRTFMMNAQAQKWTEYLGMAAGNPYAVLNFASPSITGVVHQFDADKVKEIRLAVRTPYELRAFHFERVAKDKEKGKEKEKDAGKQKDKDAGKEKDKDAGKEKEKDAGKEKEKEKEAGKEKEKDTTAKWTWTDKSSLQEFQVDPDKVAQLVKDFSKLRTERFVAFAGGPRGEHKLGEKEAKIKLELTTEDGAIITLLVGTNYQTHGYFANSSHWPDVVFFVPGSTIDPILRGSAHFSKEQLGAN